MPKHTTPATPAKPRKPKKGDRVAVYSDPVTAQEFQGNATVLRLELDGYNDFYPDKGAPPRFCWFAAVRFDGEEHTVSRWICLNDKPRA